MTLAVPGTWALVRLVDTVASYASTEDAPVSFHGLRLGMTPADVRQRFDARGELRASAANDGAYVLELAQAEGTLLAARLEFHEGLLVAIRATLDARDPAAGEEGLFSNDSIVRKTSAGANGTVELTFLSRTCPTHADEVRSLLAPVALRERNAPLRSDSISAPLH